MVDQPKERLLLSSKMTVEGPCEHPLRAHHEPEIRVHPASARRSVVASAACSELVEPDGCGQIAFRHQCAKRATDRVTRDRSPQRRRRHKTCRWRDNRSLASMR